MFSCLLICKFSDWFLGKPFFFPILQNFLEVLSFQAAEIIQQRFQDDMDSLLSDGFNKSDLSKDPPKPPDEKLMLKDKAYYLAWRLQDLNMEISKTYLDLEDGKN